MVSIESESLSVTLISIKSQPIDQTQWIPGSNKNDTWIVFCWMSWWILVKTDENLRCLNGSGLHIYWKTGQKFWPRKHIFRRGASQRQGGGVRTFWSNEHDAGTGGQLGFSEGGRHIPKTSNWCKYKWGWGWWGAFQELHLCISVYKHWSNYVEWEKMCSSRLSIGQLPTIPSPNLYSPLPLPPLSVNSEIPSDMDG